MTTDDDQTEDGPPITWKSSEAEAVHREIQSQARIALGVILAHEPAGERLAGAADQETMEMAAEIVRSGLTGLAMWWSEHPHVPREHIVRTAVGVLWNGFGSAVRES